jgi:hypothetical protein
MLLFFNLLFIGIKIADTFYQCHLCDREFSTAQALSVHRRSHEGINGFLDPMSSQKEKVEKFLVFKSKSIDWASKV